MTATGLVTRMGAEPLQQLASDYYLGLSASNRIITETYPYRTMIRELMPYDLQKAIRDACGDRLVRYKGRLVGVRLLIPCRVALDPDASAGAARTIRSTPRIGEEMTRYIASLDEKLDQLVPGIGYSNTVRDHLLRPERTDSP